MSAPPAPVPPGTTRRLLARFRPHAGAIALSVVLVLLHAAVPGALVLLVQQVLDEVLIARDPERLRQIPVALVLLYAANGGLGFARGMLTRRIAWRVITALRQELFEALLRQEPAWHRRHNSGALVARLSADVENVQYGVSGIVTLIQKPATILILLVSALRMDPVLTAVAVVALPAVVLPVRWIGDRLRRRTREGLDNRAQLGARATEALRGIETLQAARAEGAIARAYAIENSRQEQLQLQAHAARLLPSPVVELVASLGAAAVVVVGGGQVLAGHTQPGELIAFLVAVGLLNDPVKRLAEVHGLLQRAAAGAAGVFALLDRAPAIQDTGTTPFPEGPVTVALEGVAFDYGDGPVVSDLDLTIRPGEVLALVGPSGEGKSTVARLLPRLADPTAGVLRFSGVDARDIPLAQLRAKVAVVSQEPFLLDATVAENVALGRPGASEQDLEAAARAAGALDFIAALPQGWQTPLGEDGLRLSGGQRQRLCIARAFLQDAPVLVLDEPTSALDAASEAAVEAGMRALMEERTVLLISHRASTVARADRVVELGHHSR